MGHLGQVADDQTVRILHSEHDAAIVTTTIEDLVQIAAEVASQKQIAAVEAIMGDAVVMHDAVMVIETDTLDEAVLIVDREPEKDIAMAKAAETQDPVGVEAQALAPSLLVAVAPEDHVVECRVVLGIAGSVLHLGQP